MASPLEAQTRLRKSRSSSVDELAAVIALGPSSMGRPQSVAIRHIGPHEGVKLEVRGFSMDEPQAEQLVETLDHCGAPRAAGGGLHVL